MGTNHAFRRACIRAYARNPRLLLACALLASCSIDNRPRGSLVVSIDSDLEAPKDFDQVRLEWSQDGQLLERSELQVGPGQKLLPFERTIGYPGNDRPVLIRAVALSGGTPRIERSAITPVPGTWVAFLRLPLGFLCDGEVTATGESSCAKDQTCKQGACESAEITDELPRYARARATATSALQSAPDASTARADAGSDTADGCFDVDSCLASTFDVEVDRESCGFTLPPGVSEERVNVALRQGLGKPGVCVHGSCFVVLERGDEGYRIANGRVILPPAVCDRLGKSTGAQITLGLGCFAKLPSNPLCGAWSSVQTPRPQPDSSSGADTPGISVGVIGSPGSQLAPACAGAASQACGMCGTQTHACREGKWGEWGACEQEGACAPGQSEPCGRGGTRSCGGDCQWGECQSQTCVGSSTRACGMCGTETRRCLNGVWSEWSTCEGQGVCTPNATQVCGSGGTQACGGACQWGPCGNQSCAGAPSESCGRCGTRTRDCNPDTGRWSEFGACTDEGTCMPDETRACGRGGMQTCRGDCTWESACTGQSCEGGSTRACGNCGTQSRTCDSDTGSWSGWSACRGEGECGPNETRECGRGGTQVCGGNCRWNAACTGQRCQGSAILDCGNCGVQTRSCDPNSGEWLAPTACQREGECSPKDARNGAAMSCGPRGQYCDAQCRWQSCCGNGMVDPGERCDGNCPQSCPASGDACRPPRLTGSADDCSAQCVSQAITQCRGGDGCCAPGCNANSDSDCSASCGNGVKEAGETCDGDCPTRCAAGTDRCNPEQLTGSADQCNVRCVTAPITRCASGDGCCAPGCDAVNDGECAPLCNNGVLEPGERCDDGRGSTKRCPTADSCGDDDACTVDGLQGADCTRECAHARITACKSNDGCCPAGCSQPQDLDCPSLCGNGKLDPGESCDDGAGSPMRCPGTCNDGNACTRDMLMGTACSTLCVHVDITACSSNDGCCAPGCKWPADMDCEQPACGNGKLDPGESCDPGPGSAKPCPTAPSCNDNNACTVDGVAGSAAECSAKCVHDAIPTCASDGCCAPGCKWPADMDCEPPPCGNGKLDPGESCDPGPGSPAPCPTAQSCASTEQCAKGSLEGSASACTAKCVNTTITSCNPGDGCCPKGCEQPADTDCKPAPPPMTPPPPAAPCGNGKLDNGETCDPSADKPCPTLASCNDNDPCTVESLTGSADKCNVACAHKAIEACTSGDECCPSRCVYPEDKDCPS